MNRQKQTELNIIKRVFNQSLFDDIKPIEELGYPGPDFVMYPKANSGQEPFGVEVTDFFYSGTTARLQRRPGYVNHLLEGRGAHKGDKQNFEIKKLTRLPKSDENKEEFLGIIRKLPKPEEVARLLARDIEKKNKKFNKYYKALSEYHLIVYDAEVRYIGVEQKYIGHLLNHEVLIKTLKKTPFDEVLFFTKLKYGADGNKRYIVPLKKIFKIT